MIIKYYLDTSVFGGYYDDEFQTFTKLYLKRIHGYNSVNLKLGYPTLEIRSPKEMIDYEDND